MYNIIYIMTDQSNTTTVSMYYDRYEKEFGDGFYPLCKTDDLTHHQYPETNIKFELDRFGFWKQISNDMIYGLDGDHGKQLLDILNIQLLIDQGFEPFKPMQGQGQCVAGQGIRNSAGKRIYPK